MTSAEAAEEAVLLYHNFITATGYTPPTTYADLLLFVELSGGLVQICNAPDSFDGAQIGRWVYVSASDRYTDRQRMLILAHEWCHWLRRNNAAGTHYRLYARESAGEFRDLEEEIATAFERLF